MPKIGIYQMTSGINPADNAAALACAAREAKAGGAVMLFAPEMAAMIDRDRARAAPHILPFAQSAYVQGVCAAARDNALWIHGGSVPVLDEPLLDPDGTGNAGGRWRNRAFITDDQGTVRASYDKIHLFDIDLPSGESWRESRAYAPGEQAVIVETPLGDMGMTICYDLRFPRLFEALADAGAGIITVPAAFTVPTGAAHWHMLLRTRAVDYGCFIIAAAQCGQHQDGRETYGHSLVVSPWGEVLLDMGTAPGLALIDIDLAEVEQIRQRLPLRAHRRVIAPPSRQ